MVLPREFRSCKQGVEGRGYSPATRVLRWDNSDQGTFYCPAYLRALFPFLCHQRMLTAKKTAPYALNEIKDGDAFLERAACFHPHTTTMNHLGRTGR